MASIIRIKRSSVSGNPTTLGAGELAYSALADNGSNGGDRLYIGMGTETTGNAANHVIIGGKRYTDLVDAATNANTASAIVKRDASGNFSAGTITASLTGTASSATALATGRTISLTGDVSYTSGSFDGTGNVTGTATLATTAVTAGSYGSSTAIPTFTVDSKGRLTAAGTAAISTTLSLNAGGATSATVALGTDNLTFTGGTGITTSVAKVSTTSTLTIAIDSTVATLTGTQTLTNKTISGASNTLTNIGNSSLTNSSVTVGTTAISLGASSTTLAGLTSVTSTAFVGALTGNASTATTLQTARAINGVNFDGSAAITVTAAAGTLTGTTLNSTVVSSSLTSVGTIATGVWNGTTIAVANGGTGTTNGSITGTGALTFTAAAGNNNVNLVPTGTGIVDVGGKRVGNAADPTQATDLATKAYVDGLSNGLDVKASVVAASTAALTVTYSNGTGGVGATLTNAGTQAAFVLDSIALAQGDRVLIKDQAAPLQNGVYTVTTVGTISTNWVLTRATDFDNSPGTEVSPGTFFFVEQGTTQADNGYVISTNTAITIGTTAITFSQFSGAGQITAGAGLTKSGNTIDVVGTANRISVATDSIDIDAAYIGQTSITTLGTIGTGTWQGTIVGPTYGGTGVNNGSKTITLGGNLTTSGAFATTLTSTGATNVTLPTTGTLATVAGTEALTNKTVNGLTITSTTGTLTVVSGGTLATAGAYSTTLTSTAATNVTLPTTGTLATLAGAETFTNKTLTSPVIGTIVNTGTLTLPTSTDTLVGRATTDTLTNKTLTSPVISGGSIDSAAIGATTRSTGAFTTLAANGAVTFTSATDASALGTAAVVLSGGLSVAKTMYIGLNITGAGPATSTIDGFQMDGGTY